MQFIYFDLGNVLIRFDHQIACQKMAEAAGITSSLVWNVVYESNLAYRYERGEISSPEFYEAFCEGTSTSPPFATLYHASANMFEPNPGMHSLVRRLRRGEHRLGILSNTCESHWDYCLANFEWLSTEFPVQALSFRVRRMKPEPEIYRAAAELAETPPQGIFFTDDRPENVAAARAVGFDAVLFESARQITAELTRRGALTRAEREMA